MEVLCPFYRGGNWSPQDCWTCSRSQRKKMVEPAFGPFRPAPGNWLVNTALPDLPGAEVQCLRENCRNSGSGEPRSLGKGEFPIFEQGQSHHQFQLPLICPSGLVNSHMKNVNRGIHAHAYQPDHLFPTHALHFHLSAKRKKKSCQKHLRTPRMLEPSSRKTSRAWPFVPFTLAFAASS